MYVVACLVNCEVAGELSSCEISAFLIDALTDEEAARIGEEQCRAPLCEYDNMYGEPVVWRFVRVLGMQYLAETPVHGSEILSILCKSGSRPGPRLGFPGLTR